MTSYTVGGTTVGFAYDAMGRLVRKDVGGSPQRYYLWDGWTLVAELGASGTSLVAEYMYYPGLDNLYALKVGDWVYFAHTDALGSVRALTGSAGQVRRTYDYDEWGRLLPTSGDSLPFNNADRARWKGALWMGPELDLYYMRNRWYEPRTGRFLSEDPIGLGGGINQYVFAGGDPVNGHDPSGLECRSGWTRIDRWITYHLESGDVTYYEPIDVFWTVCGASAPVVGGYRTAGVRGPGRGNAGSTSGGDDPAQRAIHACQRASFVLGVSVALDLSLVAPTIRAAGALGRAVGQEVTALYTQHLTRSAASFGGPLGFVFARGEISHASRTMGRALATREFAGAAAAVGVGGELATGSSGDGFITRVGRALAGGLPFYGSYQAYQAVEAACNPD